MQVNRIEMRGGSPNIFLLFRKRVDLILFYNLKGVGSSFLLYPEWATAGLTLVLNHATNPDRSVQHLENILFLARFPVAFESIGEGHG